MPYHRHMASDDGINEEYINPLTAVLGAFIKPAAQRSALDAIDWGAPKRKKSRSLKDLGASLEQALSDREWFVTGNVDPTFFSDAFAFQDPDVKVTGIESYARGVNKIFSQQSRAEVIAVRVNGSVPNTITVTWRLEGTVNVGFGLRIKPFVVYTDLLVDDKSGLIVFQRDGFSNPGPDILLSALFPFLIGTVLLPPAPSAAVLREAFLDEEKEQQRRRK